MGLQSLIGDSRAPGEGFFGTIGSAWETGISKVGSEILPNWVQSQVFRQSGDQLDKSTFNAAYALPRQDGESIQNADSQPKNGFQKALFDLKTGDIGNMPFLILAGAVIIGLVIVLKKV